MLAIAVAVVFGPAVGGAYVSDDLQLVARSPAFAGIAHFWDAVAAPFWGVDAPYWRPVTSGAMSIGHAIAGGAPWAIHGIALLFHTGAAVAVFRIARSLGLTDRPALGTALLFALHPAHVESVAWVAALADPAFGCFSLWTLVSWLERDARQRPPVFALAMFALALAAKETALILPPLLIAADLATRDVRSAPGRYFRAWLAVAAVAAVYFALRAIAWHDPTAGLDRGFTHEVVDRSSARAAGRIAAGLASALVWPFPPRAFREVTALDAGTAIAMLGLGLLLAVAFRTARRRAAIATALLVPPLVLVVLYHGRVGAWPIADRYLYVSIAGLALAGTTVLARAADWLRVVVVLAVAVAFGITSWHAVPWWRDQASVAERAGREAADHPEARYLIARQVLDGVRRSHMGPATIARYRDAENAFLAVLERLDERRFADAWLRRELAPAATLGAAYARLFGRLEAAPAIRERFRAIVERWPGSADAAIGLGVCLAETGDATGAANAFHHALELDPGHAAATSNLAVLNRRR